ncbi:DMT family transporter, partial [Micromonospora sp. WMMD736]|uniref:DMT family transporter n=1 Tax=Micromonospora sp. WMMD736 TaxID=3404112 RepID=UPI003B959319
LTKVLLEGLAQGWSALPTLLITPEFYAWLVVAVGGIAWQQSAFRAGALTASLPTMTVAEPVVAGVLGVVVLGETLHPGEAGWLTLGVAIAAMVVATVMLARSEVAAASGEEAAPTGS